MRMWTRLNITLALVLLVASCGADDAVSSTVTTRPVTPLETGMSVPADVAEGMRSPNFVLGPAPEDAVQLARVGLADAVAVADEFSGVSDPAVAAFAVYSDSDRQARLVYVLVFEGLELYPIGGGARTGEPEEPGSVTVHHELVVLVDALTGDFISSTTFR